MNTVKYYKDGKTFFIKVSQNFRATSSYVDDKGKYHAPVSLSIAAANRLMIAKGYSRDKA